jgi:hypothetical protein
MKSYTDDLNTAYRRIALQLAFALANFNDPIKIHGLFTSA